MAIFVSDGSSTHTINDKESATILGLDFVGNGYGQVESIDKGLPTWNEIGRASCRERVSSPV